MPKPPTISHDLMASIQQGLTKQMAADRLLAHPDHQPAITAMLLNAVLHGRAKIDSMLREQPNDSSSQTVEIRISYNIKDLSHES